MSTFKLKNYKYTVQPPQEGAPAITNTSSSAATYTQSISGMPATTVTAPTGVDEFVKEHHYICLDSSDASDRLKLLKYNTASEKNPYWFDAGTGSELTGLTTLSGTVSKSENSSEIVGVGTSFTSVLEVNDLISVSASSSFAANSGSVVIAASDNIVVSSHGYSTGDTVVYTAGAGSTVIPGLSSGATYYVIKVDDNTIKLASSKRVGSELLTNGSFYGPITSGWTETRAGAADASIVNNELFLDGSSGGGDSVVVYQSFPTVIGEAYTYSFDTKTVTSHASIFVSLGSDWPGFASSDYALHNSLSSDTTYTGMFIATTTEASILVASGGGEEGNSTFDNFSVIPTGMTAVDITGVGGGGTSHTLSFDYSARVTHIESDTYLRVDSSDATTFSARAFKTPNFRFDHDKDCIIAEVWKIAPTQTLNGAISSATKQLVMNSVANVEVGAVVSGTGISGHPKVTEINGLNVIIDVEQSSLSDDVVLTFTKYFMQPYTTMDTETTTQTTWHINVDSVPIYPTTGTENGFLPVYPLDAQAAWDSGIHDGVFPGAAQEGYRAIFYKGEKENPSAQESWIKLSSKDNDWKKQTAVFQGNLLTSGSVTHSEIASDTITGAEINASSIISVYGTEADGSVSPSSFAALDGADSQYRLYVGDATPGVAPFRVTKEGKVHAKNIALYDSNNTLYFDSEQGGFQTAATTQVATSIGTDLLLYEFEELWTANLNASDSTTYQNIGFSSAATVKASLKIPMHDDFNTTVTEDFAGDLLTPFNIDVDLSETSANINETAMYNRTGSFGSKKYMSEGRAPRIGEYVKVNITNNTTAQQVQNLEGADMIDSTGTIITGTPLGSTIYFKIKAGTFSFDLNPGGVGGAGGILHFAASVASVAAPSTTTIALSQIPTSITATLTRADNTSGSNASNLATATFNRKVFYTEEGPYNPTYNNPGTGLGDPNYYEWHVTTPTGGSNNKRVIYWAGELIDTYTNESDAATVETYAASDGYTYTRVETLNNFNGSLGPWDSGGSVAGGWARYAIKRTRTGGDTHFTETHTFDSDSGAVNTTTNKITIANHGYVNNDLVIYTNGGGTSIGGLTDGTSYYVIRDDDNTIQLSETSATGGGLSAEPLSAGAVGDAHKLISTDYRINVEMDDYLFGGQMTSSLNLFVPTISSEGGGAVDTSGFIVLDDIVSTNGDYSYYSTVAYGGSTVEFDGSSSGVVDVSAETITIPSHGLSNDDDVVYSNGCLLYTSPSPRD